MNNIPESVRTLVGLLKAKPVADPERGSVWRRAWQPGEPRSRVRLRQVWENGYQQILQDGGGCVFIRARRPDDKETEALVEISYPYSGKHARALFDETGFGLSAFGPIAEGDYLFEGVNTPESILERRREALRLLDDLESECRIAVAMISRTGVMLKFLDALDADILGKWGAQAWEFFKKYYKNGLDFTPPDFTKRECLRLATDHRSLYLGGYG